MKWHSGVYSKTSLVVTKVLSGYEWLNIKRWDLADVNGWENIRYPAGCCFSKWHRPIITTEAPLYKILFQTRYRDFHGRFVILYS
jgi:hypothetical protein